MTFLTFRSCSNFDLLKFCLNVLPIYIKDLELDSVEVRGSSLISSTKILDLDNKIVISM